MGGQQENEENEDLNPTRRNIILSTNSELGGGPNLR